MAKYCCLVIICPLNTDRFTLYITKNTTHTLKSSHLIYRVAQKWHNFLYALILPNINRFSKLFHYFTVRIRRQFAIIPSLKIPRNLSCVAILPCELSTPPRGHVIGGCPEVRGGVHPHPLRKERKGVYLSKNWGHRKRTKSVGL